MTNLDSQRINEIRYNTKKIAGALEKIANKNEPRSSQIIDAYTRGWADGATEVIKTLKELINYDPENQTDIWQGDA